MTLAGLQLGPPGVYHAEVPRQPAYRTVRLDVAGFAGVAPRGPVDSAVVVTSWSDYRWRFGGYEGPGLLPWAVRAFFAQGGRRAYICRVSPLPRAPDPQALSARAAHTVEVADASGTVVPLGLLSADEGSWGSKLRIGFRFVAGGRFTAACGPAGLILPNGLAPLPFSLLRVRSPQLPPEGEFRWVESLGTVDDGPLKVRVAVPDRPLPAGRLEVEVVTITVEVVDADPALARTETFANLGLRRGHPRFAGDILSADSALVEPLPDWPDRFLPPGALLPDAGSRRDRVGEDRYDAIALDSFFGDIPAPFLPVGGAEYDGPAIHGADLLSLVTEVALLAVPDLFWSYVVPAEQVEPDDPVRPPGFVPCAPPPVRLTYLAQPPAAARLDGRYDLPEILDRQTRLVALAERQRRFVALLDVPEHLSVPATARWRSEFDSSYAAAFHPWLGVVRDDAARQQLVPPSAFAAGVIADRELRLGIPYGPANELAAQVVVAAAAVGDREHQSLHELDVNVFRAERDGFRLTAARTVSRDVGYRQLNVRRLMTMLRLMLDDQSQWLVFEPLTATLRRQLRDAIVQLLRDLYRAGAFVGDSEDEAFFVRCDDAVNPDWSSDLGRLVAEVGVAPSQPLEYLVLRISQGADGSVEVEGP